MLLKTVVVCCANSLSWSTRPSGSTIGHCIYGGLLGAGTYGCTEGLRGPDRERVLIMKTTSHHTSTCLGLNRSKVAQGLVRPSGHRAAVPRL
ncbi:hypothetical protein V8F33_010538 [Rhypophila sp. PSN 637]